MQSGLFPCYRDILDGIVPDVDEAYGHVAALQRLHEHAPARRRQVFGLHAQRILVKGQHLVVGEQ